MDPFPQKTLETENERLSKLMLPNDWISATDTKVGSEIWHEGKLWVVKKIEPGALPQVHLEPKPTPRPDWHQSWMDIAHVIGKRSYDPRLQVGAIVVAEDNTIMLSNGYNGNYAGGPNTPDSNEPGKSGFIHAEVNALIKCPYHYPVGKVMYVTDSPCEACAKCIVNAKIGTVIFDREYRDTTGVKLLAAAGIEVYKLSDLLALK
jgi:dCMP deaminase